MGPCAGQRVDYRIFTAAIGDDDTGLAALAKPRQREQLALDAETVVVVGDNRHDIEMGRNANVGLCVGVLTGTSTRDDLESIADIILDDISSLPDLI